MFFETELKKLDVEMLLGHEVNAEVVLEFAPDAVVIATGGTPLIPDVPGIDQLSVVTGLDVLRGTASVGPRVIVVGGLTVTLPRRRSPSSSPTKAATSSTSASISISRTAQRTAPDCR